MLAAVSDLCDVHRVKSCQLSVEERMACGVGACLGCAVTSSTGGYLTACKDGPVFYIGDISV
jgi:dihydroorotate dehydrogenase electron transfer subunit